MQTTLTDERIQAMAGAGHWRNESLLAYVDRWARERPTRTAFIDGRGRYTWQELARAVDLHELRPDRPRVVELGLGLLVDLLGDPHRSADRRERQPGNSPRRE